jgi:outer membrane protein OmpA-like peptidoglycan-associated protein
MRRLLTLTMLLALGACASMMGNSAPAPQYTVFFPERSSALEPAAVNVIAQAAAAANAAPSRTVTVLGWTDSIGSKPDDVLLSQQRAKRVADGLIADGVAPARISRQGRGQTGTDPGVESRRVDVTLSN